MGKRNYRQEEEDESDDSYSFPSGSEISDTSDDSDYESNTKKSKSLSAKVFPGNIDGISEGDANGIFWDEYKERSTLITSMPEHSGRPLCKQAEKDAIDNVLKQFDADRSKFSYSSEKFSDLGYREYTESVGTIHTFEFEEKKCVFVHGPKFNLEYGLVLVGMSEVVYCGHLDDHSFVCSPNFVFISELHNDDDEEEQEKVDYPKFVFDGDVKNVKIENVLSSMKTFLEATLKVQ